jgi:hypothetical protein
MKKLALIVFLVIAASTLPSIIRGFAQTPMSAWPFFVDVIPNSGAPGTYDLVVPLQVLDKSREDLADLRLYEANGGEIPYALRILNELDEQRVIEARLFNQARIGSSTSEVSVDLGENAGEHNEVEIGTTGRNFRRRVDLEGSDSGKDWRMLNSGSVIFNFESRNKVVEANRVSYQASRYRYLRVRVFADELTDQQSPDITGLKVIMAVRQKGEMTTWNVAVPSYQLLRNQGVPASAWNIDLGFRVPCYQLTLQVEDQSFSRPFYIEAIDDPENIRLVASGELTRRVGEERRPLVITLDNKEQVRKLRLLVTDYSNQTLSISSIKIGAPARQLVFELKKAPAQPLRLYFGNLKATAPHYDFEKELAVRLATAPVRTEVGVVANNPDYRPEPLPLTERIPWLIYVVLAVSSIALAIILMSLARKTLRTEPQHPEESTLQNGTP